MDYHSFGITAFPYVSLCALGERSRNKTQNFKQIYVCILFNRQNCCIKANVGFMCDGDGHLSTKCRNI